MIHLALFATLFMRTKQDEHTQRFEALTSSMVNLFDELRSDCNFSSPRSRSSDSAGSWITSHQQGPDSFDINAH
jgi:hypothetical protein